MQQSTGGCVSAAWVLRELTQNFHPAKDGLRNFLGLHNILQTLEKTDCTHCNNNIHKIIKPQPKQTSTYNPD